MDTPKVAIIILNWNGWKDAIECLESVFRIDYPNYQVIVVNNGSTDDSVEKIKAWAEGRQEVLTPEPTHPLYHLSHPPVQKPIPYIEYDRKTAEAGGLPEKEKLLYEKLPKDIPHLMILIQTGDNLGFAGGNNVGIRYVLKRKFEYIWLLNNDTVVHQEALKLMVQQYEKQAKLGIVGSIISYYDFPEKIWFRGGRLNYCLGGGFHIGKNKILLDENLSKNKLVSCDFVTGCSMLIRKEIFGDLNGFDDKFFLNYEDIDFCGRVKRRGWIIGFVDYPLIYHKVSVSQIRNNSFLIYHVNRSRIIWIRKTILVEKRLIIGLLFFLLSRVMIILKLVLKYKGRGMFSIIKGVIDGFKVSI